MTIRMYGTAWCSDCKRAKQFFGEQRVPYDFVDVDADPAGRAVVQEHNDGKDIIPTIVFDDGTVLVEPSNAELAAKLGLQTRAERSFYDLVVVGSGPSGLTAALYAAREGMDVLVIERGGVGGPGRHHRAARQLPGLPRGRDRRGVRRPAARAGGEVRRRDPLGPGGHRPSAWTASTGRCRRRTAPPYSAYAVLLAMGSTYRRLGVDGEDELIGAGVHFCATCDGAFYRGKDVVVIGGGNSAGEEGLFLTRFADHVTIVTRGAGADGERRGRAEGAGARRCRRGHRRDARWPSSSADGRFAGLVVECDGAREVIDGDGAFVFVGLSPNSELVRELVDVDDLGFVVSDVGMQTSQAGVFVAGDVRSGSTKQAASAAGEGAAAALAVRRYVEPIASGLRPMIAEAPASA